MSARWFLVGMAAAAVACGGPNTPSPPDPPTVGPATPPVVQSITVPTSRVEAGQDIAITAVVTDAETPLGQLVYTWSANVGTITGFGATVTWRHPTGLTQGVDVVITLTVVDTYDAVENNQIVQKQFIVVGTSQPFRVHDSVAETFELARKFLVDLFGNSSVPADDCMVDFADTCATAPEGKIEELAQIVEHRRDYVVVSATLLAQYVRWNSAEFGAVHTAMLYRDHPVDSPMIGTTCGDFEITVIYVGNRWWICQSFFRREDTTGCPSSDNTGGVARVMGRGRGVSIK